MKMEVVVVVGGDLTSMIEGCLPGSASTGSLRIRHSSQSQAIYNLARRQVGKEGTRCRCGLYDHLPQEC